MSKVAIVFWSGTGNTEAMANAVAEGVKAKGGEVELLAPTEFSPAVVDQYTGFAFGCPSMGSEVLEESEFQPMWDEVKSALSAKSIGLFGSYGWGDGEWMRTWQSECEDENITVVEAVLAHETPDEDALGACKSLGEQLVG